MSLADLDQKVRLINGRLKGIEEQGLVVSGGGSSGGGQGQSTNLPWIDVSQAPYNAVGTFDPTNGGTEWVPTDNGLPWNASTNTGNLSAANISHVDSNKSAFTAAVADAKASKKPIYIGPTGEFAVPADVIATNKADLGIIIAPNARLWIVDPGGVGTGISVSVTDHLFWENSTDVDGTGVPLGMRATPPIEGGGRIDGAFCGKTTVGLRYGPATDGLIDVQVCRFIGDDTEDNLHV